LSLEVPVDDVHVVNVLHAKTDLIKPVENLRFRDVLSLLFFNAFA